MSSLACQSIFRICITQYHTEAFCRFFEQPLKSKEQQNSKTRLGLAWTPSWNYPVCTWQRQWWPIKGNTSCKKAACVLRLGSPLIFTICFPATSGRNIQEKLNDARVKAIFRYVDVFLVLCDAEVEDPGNGCKEVVLTSKKVAPAESGLLTNYHWISQSSY